MKLRVSDVIFLTATWLVGSAKSVCVVRNAVWPSYFWYQCSGSTTDYLTDVKRAPLGLERISFANYDMPVLKKNSFARLGETVTVLVVNNCQLAEIEDEAFRGLDRLLSVDLSANKLTTVKGAWFVGIKNVRYVNFKYNKIRQVEKSFFQTLPNVKLLDLTNNRLTCLPVSAMSDFRARQGLELTNNPLSWKCVSEIVDWRSNKTARTYVEGVEVTHYVTKNCIARSPTPDPDDEFVNTCVLNSLNELLPNEENYTMVKLCQLWANKSSATSFKCTDNE